MGTDICGTPAAIFEDLRSGKRLGERFAIDPGVVPSVAFLPDGRLLITGLGAT